MSYRIVTLFMNEIKLTCSVRIVVLIEQLYNVTISKILY